MHAPYKQLLDDLVSRMKRAWGENLVSVVLFGSIARGEFRKDSDIDLLVVCEHLPDGQLRRQRLFIEVERQLDLEHLNRLGFYPDFSPLMKAAKEAKFLSPVYLDMVEDAVLLYDRGDFFKGILDKLRSALSKLGAKRIRIGSKWYWDLKPTYTYGEVISIE